MSRRAKWVQRAWLVLTWAVGLLLASLLIALWLEVSNLAAQADVPPLTVDIRDQSRLRSSDDSATAATYAGLAFESDFDCGTIKQGDPIRHVFSLANTSAFPLMIKSVRKSCACQEVELRGGEQIDAGASLAFAFELPSALSGSHEGELTITTDAIDPSRRDFGYRLRAYVEPTVRAEPAVVQFGDVTEGQPKVQELRIKALEPGRISDKPILRTMRGLAAVSLVRADADSLTLNVESPRSGPPGRLSDVVTIVMSTGLPRPIHVVVPVQGNLR